jgi:hypothetical protein
MGCYMSGRELHTKGRFEQLGKQPVFPSGTCCWKPTVACPLWYTFANTFSNYSYEFPLEWEEASDKIGGDGKDLHDAYEAETESKFVFYDTFISPAMWWLPEVIPVFHQI